MTIRSWGRLPLSQAQELMQVTDRLAALPARPSMLAYGNGRSYGDSCLNEGGVLLGTRRLDRYIGFDATSGIIECEAGMLLQDITDLSLPQGWFLPVTPGTAFVTVGGAIANDVHGKNHHSAGSFGNHVLCLTLLRSSGEELACSTLENADWFKATIGGLGLTGLIRTVRLQLKRVDSEWIGGDSLRFRNLSTRIATTSIRWRGSIPPRSVPGGDAVSFTAAITSLPTVAPRRHAGCGCRSHRHFPWSIRSASTRSTSCTSIVPPRSGPVYSGTTVRFFIRWTACWSGTGCTVRGVSSSINA
jgi:FAD/FMN-containing dehydrogenase